MSAEVLRVRNVNQALAAGIQLLKTHGLREQSRNGPVLVALGPVITEYERPRERVLFSALRDANPFFHLMEAVWMMAGRNDLAFVAKFNACMAEFSDDGEILHGAYGFRWRRRFGFDQLLEIAAHLRAHPESRRAVLQMWETNGDLVPNGEMRGIEGKDVPCNTHAYIDLRGGRLNLTLCCRSNDIIWGAYGANAVHFSILQEWFAAMIGVPIGTFYQLSSNYHAYTELPAFQAIGINAAVIDHYETGGLKPRPLLLDAESPSAWLEDAVVFCEGADSFWQTSFFPDVAVPMRDAWVARRERGAEAALGALDRCGATDWKRAATEWIIRRETGHASE